MEYRETFCINTVDKLINKNDKNTRTISSYYFSPVLQKNNPREWEKSFLEMLDFSKLPKADLKTYYESYSDHLVKSAVAELTGVYKPERTKRTPEDLQALLKVEALQLEMTSLKNKVKKEKQFNRKVELNMQIQKIKSNIDQIKNRLTQ